MTAAEAHEQTDGQTDIQTDRHSNCKRTYGSWSSNGIVGSHAKASVDGRVSRCELIQGTQVK